MTLRYGAGPTSAGVTFAAVSDLGICAVYLYGSEDYLLGVRRLGEQNPGRTLIEDHDAVAWVFPRITAFLGGVDCADVPLDLRRGTDFQRKVWGGLRAIPRGETRTYGALASELGMPRGARAVGSACGANTISVFIPCHRVVGSGGSIGGFYWGPERKRMLLDLERAAPE